MRRLADHDHSGGLMGVPVVGTADYQWTYDSDPTMADPGAGSLRTDTPAGTPATQFAFSTTTDTGRNAGQTFQSLAAGDLIYFQEADNAANWGRYNITAAPTDNGSWWLVPVEGVGTAGGTIAKNQLVLVRLTYGGGGGAARAPPSRSPGPRASPSWRPRRTRSPWG